MNNTINISIDNLHPFEGHPFHVKDNTEMDALVESILEFGILTPLIVRPLEGVPMEYEVISGHRRLHAAKRAGIREIPVQIYDIDRDAAAIMLVDSNLHRDHLLPSEKAFAYKLKMEALRHQGKTSRQPGEKWSVTAVSDAANESERQIHRYIRLTELLPGLLKLVDEGRIAFTVGVELSYLTTEEQSAVLDAVELYDCTPSYSQACRMHHESEMVYSSDPRKRINAIMSEEKPNQKEKVSFRYADLQKFFPSNYTPKQISDAILRLVEADYRRRRDRDAR